MKALLFCLGIGLSCLFGCDPGKVTDTNGVGGEGGSSTSVSDAGATTGTVPVEFCPLFSIQELGPGQSPLVEASASGFAAVWSEGVNSPARFVAFDEIGGPLIDQVVLPDSEARIGVLAGLSAGYFVTVAMQSGEWLVATGTRFDAGGMLIGSTSATNLATAAVEMEQFTIAAWSQLEQDLMSPTGIAGTTYHFGVVDMTGNVIEESTVLTDAGANGKIVGMAHLTTPIAMGVYHSLEQGDGQPIELGITIRSALAIPPVYTPFYQTSPGDNIEPSFWDVFSKNELFLAYWGTQNTQTGERHSYLTEMTKDGMVGTSYELPPNVRSLAPTQTGFTATIFDGSTLFVAELNDTGVLKNESLVAEDITLDPLGNPGVAVLGVLRAVTWSQVKQAGSQAMIAFMKCDNP